MILDLLLGSYLLGVLIFSVTQSKILKEEEFSLPWIIGLSILWPLVILDFIYFFIFIDKGS